MTIRDKVQKLISKPPSEYNLFDIVELSKLKLGIGEDAMKARSDASIADQKYRLDRARKYMTHKMEKCTDKRAMDQAFIDTEEARTKVEVAKYKSELMTTYHRDLNDIVVAVRMCARVYDNALNDKLEH